MKWNPVMKVWKKSEWWDMKEILDFGPSIGLLPLILIISWNETLLWRLKEIGVDVNEIWRKMLCFRVSIGLLPLILIISWNETLLWRFERNWVDVNEIWRKMLSFRVSIGFLPLILIVSWNETLLWRFERNQSWCQWDMKENVVF